MLSNFIFEQTEYVYSFLTRAGASDDPTTAQQLPNVYRMCLQSYQTITAFLKEQGDSSPYSLFTQ